MKWTDINWDLKTIGVESPKTKRHGKVERTLPMFEKLDQELAQHRQLTADESEYVIDIPVLRKTGASLSTRFKEIVKTAGISPIEHPFPNLRMSCANDFARIVGVTTKNLTDWMGHDMKTALTHYQKTTSDDFRKALAADPFPNCGYILPENGEVPRSRDSKNPEKASTEKHQREKSTPSRTRTRSKNTCKNGGLWFGTPTGSPIADNQEGRGRGIVENLDGVRVC